MKGEGVSEWGGGGEEEGEGKMKDYICYCGIESRRFVLLKEMKKKKKKNEKGSPTRPPIHPHTGIGASWGASETSWEAFCGKRKGERRKERSEQKTNHQEGNEKQTFVIKIKRERIVFEIVPIKPAAKDKLFSIK